MEPLEPYYSFPYLGHITSSCIIISIGKSCITTCVRLVNSGGVIYKGVNKDDSNGMVLCNVI